MTRLFPIAVFLRGAIAVIAQALLVRELLVVFNGNELTFSLILSVWLVSGAAGSVLASYLYSRLRNPVVLFANLQLLSGIWLACAIILVRSARFLLDVPAGEVLSLGQIALVIALSLPSASFLDGAMFTIGFRTIKSVARLYMLECAGSLVAGLLFSFLLLNILTNLQISLLLAVAASLLAALLLANQKQGSAKVAAFFCLLAMAGFFFAPELGKKTLAFQWREFTLESVRDSRYGNIVVTRQDEQKTVFYDGMPLVSLPEGEGYFSQDFIHLAMLAAGNPRSALFLGNAVGGLLSEAEKYPLRSLAYAEMDPALIQTLCGLDFDVIRRELGDARLKIIPRDGRNYLKTTDERFDIVFVNMGIATSLFINRYSTKEFFAEVDEHLTTGGLVVFKAWGSLAYLSEEMKRINASLLKTAYSIFPHIRIIPGDGYNIYLASNSPITADPKEMAAKMTQLGIRSDVISYPYLVSRMDDAYQKWFHESVKTSLLEACVNEDLRPCRLFDGLALYYSQFSKKIPAFFRGFSRLSANVLFPSVFVFMLAWSAWVKKTRKKLPAIGFTIFTTGFFGMGLQISVIFLFQSFLGYIYQWLAVLTAAFMAGGSAGSLLALRQKQKFGSIRELAAVEILAPTLSAGLAFLVILGVESPLWSEILTQGWIFALISASAGLLVGLELPAAYRILRPKSSEEQQQRAVGWIYGLDLLGGCSAALLTPLALIPSIGIGWTILLFWVMKMMNARGLLKARESLS
ncbi:MAG: hypothetical protein WC732_05385 [Candidatus Omnitrophota bacterium]